MNPAAARYATVLPDGRIRCDVCHHACTLSEGAVGLCGTRRARSGRLELPFYGAISSIAVDPIEKKPLYHFLPGSGILSLGFVGCNLRCPFCQNYAISQSTDAATERLSPGDAVDTARSAGSASLAYTYSEPLIHAEYLVDCMTLAREAGIKNVLVTNGHAIGRARDDILSLCDAANVDLKAWNPDFYRKELSGNRDVVLDFIRAAAGAGVHVEITTLVIPGANDAESDIAAIADFIAALDPGLPFHLSAYRPMYRYRVPPTPSPLLARCRAIASERLRYVYVGNAPGFDDDTRCRSCGAVLVARSGYRISKTGLRGSTCAACGAEAPFILA